MSYGCYNRPEYQTILKMQDGWYMDGYTRTPRMQAVPFQMSTECQYTHTYLGQADARCIDCRWRSADQPV